MTLRAWFITMVFVGILNMLAICAVWYDLHDRADDVKTKIDSRLNELQFTLNCS